MRRCRFQKQEKIKIISYNRLLICFNDIILCYNRHIFYKIFSSYPENYWDAFLFVMLKL